MQKNIEFRELVKDKFNKEIKTNYLPDRVYIDRLMASLNKVEANSYNTCHDSFVYEYTNLKKSDAALSIKVFVLSCLNQLLWINSILESGIFKSSEIDIEEEFDYVRPAMSGNFWFLKRVTKKGVYFSGEEPYQDKQVVINSDNIVDIAKALFIVFEKNKQGDQDHAKQYDSINSVLFTSKELEKECLNILKEIKNPVLDADGNFIGKKGMIAAIVYWLEKCIVFSFISKDIVSSRDNYTKELMNIIPNLSMHGSNISKNTKAKKYRAEIEERLQELYQKQKKRR